MCKVGHGLELPVLTLCGIPNPMWDTMPVTREFLAYRLFIVNQKGVITELGGKKKDVINAFDSNQSDLKKYIKQEKLK